MKYALPFLFLSMFLSIQPLSAQGEYYEFPFEGWQQSYTSFEHTGYQYQKWVRTYTHEGDTLLDNKEYEVFGGRYFRYEDGIMYHKTYNGAVQIYFDFSLEVGDTFTNYRYSAQQAATVFSKERKTTLLGDSIWYMGLQYSENPMTPTYKDTFYWIEGVGYKSTGLVDARAPDGGLLHACTHLEDFRKI